MRIRDVKVGEDYACARTPDDEFHRVRALPAVAAVAPQIAEAVEASTYVRVAFLSDDGQDMGRITYVPSRSLRARWSEVEAERALEEEARAARTRVTLRQVGINREAIEAINALLPPGAWNGVNHTTPRGLLALLRAAVEQATTASTR